VLGVTGFYAALPRRLAQILNRDGRFRIYELPLQHRCATVTGQGYDNVDRDEGNL
jgi:hypothetical protein